MGNKSIKAANFLSSHLANPFLVLDLPVSAPAETVERKGGLLLAMLAAGLADATIYQSPFGPRERTPEMVREALAELRDPGRRLVHEWWSRKEVP
jgi:hypothetical protein